MGLRKVFRKIRPLDVLFVCSSSIDEVWIRSTARACHGRRLSVRVVICDDARGDGAALADIYRDAEVPLEITGSLASAAGIGCRLAVTASSGIDRGIFPTSAKALVHMPHSLASLHMIYPPDAFDGYNVLLAAGPHHCAEFEALGRARGRQARTCLPTGYGKLDVLVDRTAETPLVAESPHVLIAPSWGADNLLDRLGIPLAEALADHGYAVTVRPHPLFFLESAPVVAGLETLAGRRPEVRLESPLEGDDAIHTADLMIGDYSGTSFEFAALRRRPVVSVDVGLKVVNPDWRSLGLPPMEVEGRAALGPVVAPELDAIATAVDSCLAGEAAPIEDATVERFLFGRPGECGSRAAEHLVQLLLEAA